MLLFLEREGGGTFWDEVFIVVAGITVVFSLVWPVKEEVTVTFTVVPFELDITLARRLPLPVLLSLVGLEF